MNTFSNQQKKKDITIIAVMHNDVPASARKTIHADYFYPLVTELGRFVERKVNVVYAISEPQSSFNYTAYGTEKEATVQRWQTLASSIRSEMIGEGLDHSHLIYVILLTRNPLDPTTAGVARHRGFAAIASLVSYTTVGHEVGHMLGATHEDAEVQYKNGWWAETYMHPSPELLRSNAYSFSATNRQNILNELAHRE